mgnify:FL=1|tara:strand:+ start:31081 stop:31983 length:903 start_codon:yes stop_codon:yes gene_type:complete
MKLNVGEIDIIYLSYDEPNAEQNYTDLLSKVPWAKRIHGIKGSDAAHKACAELSETDRFVTVDGDNTVDQNFINQVLEFDPKENLENSVISWCGKNTINGLVYGNGGLKCWPKQYVLNMKTHENADKENINAQIEFCWDARYVQMADCFSNVHNNATPYQAWRAGFREGVKLALNRGARIPKEQFLKSHQKNLAMLYIWCMVGADVKNGSWAIYGAREGLFMTMCSDWDYVNVRDFDCLNELWGGRDELPEDVLHSEIFNLGNQLIDKLEIPIAVQPLNEEQSNFFKSVNDSTVRKNNYK